jgi:orotidine-5'-phosphate decarboxylase
MTFAAKDIPAKDRLIFALDVPSPDEAKALVEELGDAVTFYKIGMELLMAGGYFELLDWLVAKGKKVFVDLKFFDVPATVGKAIAALSDKGATLATIHGNQSIMEAAAKAKSGDLKVLAVTALTSLDRGDLNDLGFQCEVEDLVLSRAKRALEAGVDGVVSSGMEAERLREFIDHKLLVITPGIRPVDNTEDDDQKRVMTPAAALKAGADYLVVGRPIRNAQNRREKALEIQAEIAAAISA